MRNKRNVYVVSVGKPEAKGPLEKPRHRWKYTIKLVPHKRKRKALAELTFRCRNFLLNFSTPCN